MKDIFKFSNGIFIIQESQQKIQKYEKIRYNKKKIMNEDETPTSDGPPPEESPSQADNTNIEALPPENINNVFDFIDKLFGEDFSSGESRNEISTLFTNVEKWAQQTKISLGNLNTKYADNLIDRARDTRPELSTRHKVRDPVVPDTPYTRARAGAELAANLPGIDASVSPEGDNHSDSGNDQERNPLFKRLNPTSPQKNPPTGPNTDSENIRKKVDVASGVPEVSAYISANPDNENKFYALLLKNDEFKNATADNEIKTIAKEIVTYLDQANQTNESKYFNPRQPKKIIRHPSLGKW